MQAIYNQTITKEEVAKLPRYSFLGDVVCIDNITDYRAVIDEIFLETLWGFDTETRPCFSKGMASRHRVSLLQLSNSEKTYIFRLNRIGMQKELLNFLSSDRFVKIGLATTDDIKGLQKLSNFKPAGFIDLQTIAPKYGIDEKGLRKLAAIVLNINISKAQQLTNWEADVLTEKQIRYAATDSWVTRQIYVKLTNNDGNNIQI